MEDSQSGFWLVKVKEIINSHPRLPQTHRILGLPEDLLRESNFLSHFYTASEWVGDYNKLIILPRNKGR